MSGDAECRICFSGQSESQPTCDEPEYLKNPKLDRMLTSACDCKGTMSHVHERCLLKWLKMKNSKRCDLCTAKFVIREESGDWPAQYRAFKKI